MPTLKRILSNAQVRNLLLLVIIIVVFLIFQLGRSNGLHALELDKDGLTLTAPGGEVAVVIKYRDIESISEVDTLDVGTFLSGTDTSKCQFGTWSNDAYGEYSLCISPKIKDYIVLQTAHGVVVFNFESTDTTQHLYPALLEVLETYPDGE